MKIAWKKSMKIQDKNKKVKNGKSARVKSCLPTIFTDWARRIHTINFEKYMKISYLMAIMSPYVATVNFVKRRYTQIRFFRLP